MARPTKSVSITDPSRANQPTKTALGPSLAAVKRIRFHTAVPAGYAVGRKSRLANGKAGKANTASHRATIAGLSVITPNYIKPPSGTRKN